MQSIIQERDGQDKIVAWLDASRPEFCVVTAQVKMECDAGSGRMERYSIPLVPASELAALRAQLAERDEQLAAVKESARRAASAINMIPAAPDGRLPHIGAAIRHLNEIAGLGSAALITMPIACAQCGEEHPNNTKEAWAIIHLGCCIKCEAKRAQQDHASIAASEARERELAQMLQEALDADNNDQVLGSGLADRIRVALASRKGG